MQGLKWLQRKTKMGYEQLLAGFLENASLQSSGQLNSIQRSAGPMASPTWLFHTMIKDDELEELFLARLASVLKSIDIVSIYMAKCLSKEHPIRSIYRMT